MEYLNKLTSFLSLVNTNLLQPCLTKVRNHPYTELTKQKINNYYQYTRNKITEKRQKIRKLHKNVVSVHPEYNFLQGWLNTFRIIFIDFRNEARQRIYGIKRTKTNSYELNYYHKNRYYTVIVKSRNGPPLDRQFYVTDNDLTEGLDDNKNEMREITHDILKYLGPNMDFHGMKLTPNDIGISSILFMRDNGGNFKSFGKDEVIEC